MSVKHSVLQFKFENFEGLSTVRNEVVVSNKVTDCDGNEWDLILYPGGKTGADYESADGMMALFFFNAEVDEHKYKRMTVGFEFIVRNYMGGVHATRRCTSDFKEVGAMCGGVNFIRRSEVLDKSNNILFEGALHIDVHLQTNLDPVAKPHLSLTSPHEQNYLQLLQNESNADVTFKVGEEVITAHKLILETNAPILFEFCRESKKDVCIPINGTSPENFRVMLRYIYGGKIPDLHLENENDTAVPVGLIDISDRYGVVGLKLEVERAVVESMFLDSCDVVELLILAESKTCALLKEYAMSYIAARPDDILTSKYAKELKETPELLTELITKVSNNRDTRFVSAEKKMSVAELRNTLEEKGLDIDGSKEMLVSRLENANKRQRTE